MQSLQEGDEGFGGDSLVEDHDAIDTTVGGDRCHDGEVRMVEAFLIDSLVGAFRSILDTRHGALGEDHLINIDDALFQPPGFLQLPPTFFLPLQVFLDAVVSATFEASQDFAFDVVLLVEATQS